MHPAGSTMEKRAWKASLHAPGAWTLHSATNVLLYQEIMGYPSRVEKGYTFGFCSVSHCIHDVGASYAIGWFGVTGWGGWYTMFTGAYPLNIAWYPPWLDGYSVVATGYPAGSMGFSNLTTTPCCFELLPEINKEIIYHEWSFTKNSTIHAISYTCTIMYT